VAAVHWRHLPARRREPARLGGLHGDRRRRPPAEHPGPLVHRPALRPALLDLARRELHVADVGSDRVANSGVTHAGHPRVVPSGDRATTSR
jgi:hypothetical protein